MAIQRPADLQDCPTCNSRPAARLELKGIPEVEVYCSCGEVYYQLDL